MQRRYGWRRDLPDHRDLTFRVAPRLAPLPRKVDLRPQFPTPCYDQGALGSCTAQAVAAAVQFARRKAGFVPDFTPSRLGIYLMERLIEGNRLDDSGAFLRTGFKSIGRHGVWDEKDWPYKPERYTETPPDECFAFGRGHTAIEYRSVAPVLSDLKAVLAEGFPFCLGIAIFESFETAQVAKTGIVPFPKDGESFLGGHAILAMGYDSDRHAFLCRNSWGPGWGEGGYFWLPFIYVQELGADFWVVTRVSA